MSFSLNISKQTPEQAFFQALFYNQWTETQFLPFLFFIFEALLKDFHSIHIIFLPFGLDTYKHA